MVNQFDSTTNINLTLFLDVEDAAIVKQEELQEESIRIAASLVARLMKERMECEVISNGIRETLVMDTGAKLHDFYRKMACIDIRKSVSPICDRLGREAEKMAAGHVVILISKNQDEKLMEAVQNICRTGSSVVWVIPVLPDHPPTASSIGNLQILPWKQDKEA